MNDNMFILAAAGSGKTTLLVEQALKIKDKNVLLSTYTEANEDEIKSKILKATSGFLPRNITIQSWFSFLLQHGVRPYQNLIDDELHNKKIGFYLTGRKSGFKYKNRYGKLIYWGEKDTIKYYFTKDFKIYSDKISKFIVQCNEHSEGELINRIARIFQYIFIDEVQDLAGWDLEILKLLFDSSACVSLVGDPRQVTYLTHHPQKHKKYKDGKIEAFISEQCDDGVCKIDDYTLNKSHRNNADICRFSSALFPEFAPCAPCTCDACRNHEIAHEGVFLVRPEDIRTYCELWSPTILRYNGATYPEWNFGKSKGLSFENVLIYPTKKIVNYLIDGDVSKISTIREKFYVALTRAEHSVGIVFDYDDETEYIEGLKKYKET